MDNNSIKKNIIRQRKLRNLSQLEMATRLGISRTAYRNIENGRTKLIHDRVPEIAAILEIDTEKLILGLRASHGNSFLEDEKNDNYNNALTKLKASHSEEIRKLNDEILHLRNNLDSSRRYIEAQQEIIKNKDEIITMLKKVDSDSRNG